MTRLPFHCDCGATLARAIYPVHCRCGKRHDSPGQCHRKPRKPLWVLMLTMLRTEADKGVGDTAQRLAASMGGERFKVLSRQIGLPCRCSQRQEQWNRDWPY